MPPTPERFRRLARSSPWRWRTLRPSTAYDPMCECCALLWTRDIAARLVEQGWPPQPEPAGFAGAPAPR